MAVDLSGVLAGKTVVRVATGANHSLALCSDGTLAAWGYNYYGQIGHRGFDLSATCRTLVSRSGVLAGKTVVAIAAGYYLQPGVVFGWHPRRMGAQQQRSIGRRHLTNSVPVAVSRTGVLAGKTVISHCRWRLPLYGAMY